MDPSREKTVSKFMSLVLRHEPEALGVAMDGHGWVDFSELCAGLQDKFDVSREDVLGIVARDPKSRYTLEGNRIRAAQGHSLDVALDLEARPPPEWLYHGTNRNAFEAIETEGLTRQARTHVHLSPDCDTATMVGSRRRGGLVILQVAAGKMAEAGYVFYLSQNGVWLTDHVPPQFITPLRGT
ncbi:MAG: RNA 2'-phosphotransferase [Hyphomicrobiaceae bacterium]